MEIYINGTGCISPQATFDESTFTPASLKATNSNRLKCIEPEYKNYINPPLLRRMSRMIKMGIASSRICLDNAGITMPGAIITGTGLGCIEDTEKFTVSILENHEQLLAPTPFIQSTHNTVGGQIALLLGCHEYNYTYVHRGLSFESALLDAAMMIDEGSADNILVGGIDELTDRSFKLLQQLGIYSNQENVGTPGGEGSAFFLLSGKKSERSLAKISLLKTFSSTNDPTLISEKIKALMPASNVDLVLTGETGHAKTDDIFQKVKKIAFLNHSFDTFKQYCGEYHTASAFALWLAVQKLSKGNLNSVLVYNHFIGSDHSCMLVEKC